MTVAYGLKFHWYLWTLSLKFQKAAQWSSLVVDPTLKFPVDPGIDLIGLFSLKSIVDFEFGAKKTISGSYGI